MHSQYVQPGAYLMSNPGTSYQPATWAHGNNYQAASPQFPPQQAYYVDTPYSQPSPRYPSSHNSPTSTFSASSPSSASSTAFSPLVSYAPTPQYEHPKQYKAARRASKVASVSYAPTHSYTAPAALSDFVDHAPGERPSYSIKALCEAALRGSKKGKLTLGEICEIIQDRYPYYRDPEQSRKLRASARHDLSIDPRFSSHKRGPLNPGRGAYWTFNEGLIPAAQLKPKAASTPYDVPATSKGRRKSKTATTFVASPSPMHYTGLPATHDFGHYTIH